MNNIKYNIKNEPKACELIEPINAKTLQMFYKIKD